MYSSFSIAALFETAMPVKFTDVGSSIAMYLYGVLIVLSTMLTLDPELSTRVARLCCKEIQTPTDFGNLPI